VGLVIVIMIVIVVVLMVFNLYISGIPSIFSRLSGFDLSDLEETINLFLLTVATRRKPIDCFVLDYIDSTFLDLLNVLSILLLWKSTIGAGVRMSSVTRDWSISSAQRGKYSQLFNSNDRLHKGFLTGKFILCGLLLTSGCVCWIQPLAVLGYLVKHYWYNCLPIMVILCRTDYLSV